MSVCRVCGVSLNEGEKNCPNCGIELNKDNICSDNFVFDTTSEEEIIEKKSKTNAFKIAVISSSGAVVVVFIVILIVSWITYNPLIGDWITADGAKITITSDKIDIEGTVLYYQIYDDNIIKFNSDANSDVDFYWAYEIKDKKLYITMTLDGDTKTQTCTRA